MTKTTKSLEGGAGRLGRLVSTTKVVNQATSSPPAQLTSFKGNCVAVLAKRYKLVGSALEKTGAGQLVRGEYKVLSLHDPVEFAKLLKGLQPNEALAYGVPLCSKKQGAITSRKEAAPGELTRTRENFDWPKGPAIMFLDYDPPKGAEPLTAETLWERVHVICPALALAPAVIMSSASGFIYNAETDEELKGAGGWHIYVFVADGRDVSRFTNGLYDQTWLCGYGRFDISISGAMLERSLFDAAVWQPERMDFAAGAICDAPLDQRRPEPLVINPAAALFDTHKVQSIPAVEELEKLKAEARAVVADEAKKVRADWLSSRVADAMATAIETDPDKLNQQRKQLHDIYRRACENGVLLGGFVLIAEDGQRVAVSELLDNPGQWHGKRFADPLEPEYNNDQRVARVNLQSGGRPNLYSHAHGGRGYTLIRAPQTVQVMNGGMPQVVEVVQQHAYKAGEIYQRGGELVRVADGVLLSVHPSWLKTHLETVSRFENFKKEKAVQGDCPGDLPKRILANRGGWPFDELVGILTAPTIRPDGSLLGQPGYDKTTGLLLLDVQSDRWPTIPANPTAEQARYALQRLWEPFEHFPFVKPIDRGVALAAMLTAVIRRTLPTAPGFGISAHQMGTGKTKLAQCLGILTNGHVPTVSPWSDNIEEQRKTILSAYLPGPGAILFDNIERRVVSPELCAVLTCETYEDRKLSLSELVKVSTRVLLLVTGNNLCITGDLSRRILPINLDHGVERPDILSFPFDPVSRVLERWLQLRVCALTILRAFVVAGSPSKGAGKMGSFEAWDSLVRQCIVWLRDNNLAPFELADPADAVNETITADPDTQRLRNLLHCWYDKFQDEPTTVRYLTAQETSSKLGLPFDELHELLREIAGEGNSVNPRKLGNYIKRHAGRLIDGKKFVDGGRSGGSCRWKVVIVAK